MSGILAIFSAGDSIEELFWRLFRLQSRGQEYCGISTCSGNEIKIRTHRGLVRPTFQHDLAGLEGGFGIGHTSSRDRQPVKMETKMGGFTIGFDGHITNGEKLRNGLLKQGHSFSTLADVELVAKLIAQGKDIEDGLERMLETIKGPCSLVLLTKDGIYAARDRLGFRPLVLGFNEVGYAVASETCAFGLKMEIGQTKISPMRRSRDIEPGEIIFLGQNGVTVTTIKKLGDGRKKHCCFEWVYYARPDSIIEGISVTRVRQNLGRFLAQGDEVEADLVAPVPFSGICHAEGYHLESGLTFLGIILSPQYMERTYMIPIPTERQQEAEIKPNLIEENIRDKRIILIDDSIRSGITIRDLVKALKEAGAKEVHVRIASPLSIKYCPFEPPPQEEEKFIAATKSVEEIRDFIGADSLRFQKLENVSRAIGLSKKDLCLDCFLR